MFGINFPWCCNDDAPKQVHGAQSLLQFTYQDTKSKKFERKVMKHQPGVIHPSYEDWKRLKYRSKNAKQLLRASVGEDGKFVDPDFPHTNENISSEEELEQKFVWMRVGNLYKNPVYSNPQSLDFFQKFSFNQKALKQALSFISRTHLQKMKEFLTKDFSDVGLYEFKFYRNGIIQNVIIDDFVPTYNKQPLFTGAVRGREVYPMIIEKALAKICGGYDKIPTDMDELLEILFCGPLRKTKINDLNDRQAVQKSIDSILKQRGVAGFISKKQGKVRNYGINENEIYHVVNKYEIRIDSKKTILYQMISEKKLSSWNGRFGFNDSIWEKIESGIANHIFQSMKANKSFCMPETDLVHIFDHLMIFQGTQSYNKDWVQNYSDTNYPSFSEFQVTEPSTVFIRICCNDELRTSLMLSQAVDNKTFQFIQGSFSQNAYSCELIHYLLPGRYIVSVFHDWILEKSGPYRIFISSSCHTSLVRDPENYFPSFLESLFINHSNQMRKHNTLDKKFKANRFYSTCMLTDVTGFAYLHVWIKDYKRDIMVIKINEKVLFEDRWELMQPHTGRRQIQLVKGQKQQLILVIKTTKHLNLQKAHFPATAFIIQQ